MRLLLIDEERLRLLIRPGKKAAILAAAVEVLGGAINVNSALPDNIIQLVLGIAIIGAGLFHGWRLYADKDLFKEIVNMDQTAHHHSIVVIKDSFCDYPNRFLVYWDPVWECLLFPNYPTQTTAAENAKALKARLSADLKISPSSISVEKKGEAVQSKFSPRHQQNRIYDHLFYAVAISDFPSALQASSFSIEGKDYRWMTIAEMQNDPTIRAKNSDIVNEINKLRI